MSDEVIGGPCKTCGQQGIFNCCGPEDLVAIVTENNTKCGCGRPVRYMTATNPPVWSCNKYARCQTYSEIASRLEISRLKLKESLEYCEELLNCWGWKKCERAGNAQEYENLLKFIESLKSTVG